MSSSVQRIVRLATRPESLLVTVAALVGTGISIFQTVRCAMKSPDVVWSKEQRETNLGFGVDSQESAEYYEHPMRKFARSRFDTLTYEPHFSKQTPYTLSSAK
eukprot:GILJ01006938.1.p1 GENE.GILJ01006938.1~~GILJ01006938.1.p1  ORF type:complete len:103 (+),score=11.08 GILJ01006938.1:216-524(+)